MLSYYIRLRFYHFLRFFSFSDVKPAIGIPILAVIFVIVSMLLFERISYAGWTYAGLAFVTVMEMQDDKANTFIRQYLNPRQFFKLKLPENAIILSPFLLVLTCYGEWLPAMAALTLLIPYSYYSRKIPKPKLKSLPTPYRAYSFEYNYAFRLFFAVYIAYVALMVIAAMAHNVYLFLVPFFILLFFIQSCYGTPEGLYYIWVHKKSATQFLMNKLKQAIISLFITALPMLILGGIFFWDKFELIGLCTIYGGMALAGSMLMKYHFYPNAFIIQISQILLFGFTVACITSPPSIIVILVFLIFSFFRAKSNLQTWLYAENRESQ